MLIGPLFIPILAVVLLLMNRRKLVGNASNHPVTALMLVLTLALALVASYFEVRRRFG